MNLAMTRPRREERRPGSSVRDGAWRLRVDRADCTCFSRDRPNRRATRVCVARGDAVFAGWNAAVCAVPGKFAGARAGCEELRAGEEYFSRQCASRILTFAEVVIRLFVANSWDDAGQR